MITTRKELRAYLRQDSLNYAGQNSGFVTKLKNNMLADTISDQKYIWKYIRALRYAEYWSNQPRTITNMIGKCYSLWVLRRMAYKTGFQIPCNVCGPGLTIWHFGSIVVNEHSRIGENCTFLPGVIVGHKKTGNGCPCIGNNVPLMGGCKVFGDITIGDNVTIGPMAVIVKDVPTNCTVVGNPARIICKDGVKVNIKL